MADSRKQLSPAGQRIFLAVFFLICAGVGLGFWIPNFLLPVLDWSHTRKWRETPCTVLRAPAGEVDTQAFEFSFRYEFEGETYESSDPGATGLFDSPVWTLKPGAVTVCYVNPHNPRQAVLSRNFNHEIWVWCAPLVFVIFPGLALLVSLRNAGRPPATEPGALPPLRDGMRVIEAERRRGSMAVQFGCLLVFAGLGAVVVLVPGFRQSWPIRAIYLAPLILGTWTMLRFMLHRLLTAFYPRLVLTVTPAQPAPGQTVELRWENRGGVGTGKGFRIVLEGREEVRTASRGNSVKTEPFATLEVVQSGPKDLRRGLAKVKIPGPAMHSLTQGRCSILWAFRVFVDRTRWPRDGEEYRFEVAARKEGAT